MKKVAVVTDSGSGLSINELAKYNVYSVPLQYINGNESKLELEEMSFEELYDQLDEGIMYKTSLSPVGLVEELFTKLKDEGYTDILAFPICSGLSGNIQSMKMVAEQLGINFEYVDTHTPSIIEAYLSVYARNMLDSGKSIEEIKMIAESVVDTANTIIVPEDLKHLSRGGRLTPMAAALGGLLKIKPILQINKSTLGRVDVVDKVRTTTKAYAKVVEKVVEEINDGEGYMLVSGGVHNDEGRDKLLSMIQEACPKLEIHPIPFPGVVGVHTGPKCVGIQYFKKIDM